MSINIQIKVANFVIFLFICFSFLKEFRLFWQPEIAVYSSFRTYSDFGFTGFYFYRIGLEKWQVFYLSFRD